MAVSVQDVGTVNLSHIDCMNYCPRWFFGIPTNHEVKISRKGELNYCVLFPLVGCLLLVILKK